MQAVRVYGIISLIGYVDLEMTLIMNQNDVEGSVVAVLIIIMFDSQ